MPYPGNRKYGPNPNPQQPNGQDYYKRSPYSNKPKMKQVVRNSSLAKRQKSLIDEFKDSFVSKDKIDMGTYLVRDVLVPTVQNTILDYLSMRFFGAGQMGQNNRRYGYGRSIFDYGRDVFNNYAGSYGNQNYGRNTGQPNNPMPPRGRIDFKEVVLLDIEDAKRIVMELRNRINMYNEATVSDLYSAIGVTSNYKDEEWGWINAGDIGIKRVPEGWLIDVADPIHLER